MAAVLQSAAERQESSSSEIAGALQGGCQLITGRPAPAQGMGGLRERDPGHQHGPCRGIRAAERRCSRPGLERAATGQRTMSPPHDRPGSPRPGLRA